MANWLATLKTYAKALDDLSKATGDGDLAKIKDIVLDDATALQKVLGTETSKTLGNLYDLAKAVDDLTKAAGNGDLAAMKVIIDALPNAGALSDLATILADTAELQVSLANGGFTDLLIDAIKAETALIVVDTNELQTDLVNGGRLDLLIDAIKVVTDALPNAGALNDLATILADTAELQVSLADGGFTDLLIDAITTHLTDIKGGTWSNETLVAIKAAIDTIAGVNTYQEQIPDTDFALAAIDDTLTADPPTADAENSVVDIDANAGDTFVLRSLWVNVTSLGTAGTKVTFKLWLPINSVVTMVDSVEITATGISNLMDLFAIPEVHGDSIHVTVETDSESADAAVSGTYKYAKAT